MGTLTESYIERHLASEDLPLSDALPLLFKHKGHPYSLDWSHFFFEPMFRLRRRPRRRIFKCGRQVAKTSSAAHYQSLLCATVPHFKVMNCTPFFEQARRFSVNNVAPAIRGFTLREMFLRGGGSVLQRDCTNESSMLFVSMQGSADRARSASVDYIVFDETQDIDPVNIPVAQNCLAASLYKMEDYLGTPKTFDNLLQERWDYSSQAVWVTPCDHCGFENYACTDQHLLKMIDGPTLVCAKCRKPLNTRLGFFEHALPERQRTFAGYHVPQPILPMHYEDANSWDVIQTAIQTYPKYRLYNEILGESFDSGSKLLTIADLQKAAILPGTKPRDIKSAAYVCVGTGIDWGGRGKEIATDVEEHISNTATALGGMRPDGVVEVTHVARVPYSVDHNEEVRMVAEVAGYSRSSMVALDYGGQGNVMQTMLIGAGCPENLIVPFTYTGTVPRKPIVQYHPPTAAGVRSSYSLDKTRSLLLLVELIKRGLVLLPNYDKNKHCLQDFLAIYEESVDSPTGSKHRRVCRMRRRTDDVVHAINFLVMGLYHRTERWPALAKLFASS